jgi:hypothetical protein
MRATIAGQLLNLTASPTFDPPQQGLQATDGAHRAEDRHGEPRARGRRQARSANRSRCSASPSSLIPTTCGGTEPHAHSHVAGKGSVGLGLRLACQGECRGASAGVELEATEKRMERAPPLDLNTLKDACAATFWSISATSICRRRRAPPGSRRRNRRPGPQEPLG